MKKMQAKFGSLLSGNFESLPMENMVVIENSTLLYLGRFFNSTAKNVLEDFNKYGVQGLTSLDGDFTLLIVKDEKIHIIRDRHGVGSQVFYSEDYFSTELTDFVHLEGFTCKPNIEALFTFMSIGFIPGPLTSLENVQKLNAGCMLTIGKDKVVSVIDLFPVEDFLARTNTTKLSMEEATLEYERLHKKSIETRIEGKKQIGLLLSGGYDSGGNISALRDIYDGNVCSFSIGFKNNQWTELPLAKILANRYKSNHHDYEIDGSEIMNLPKIVGATGDPFQEGGLLVNYTAMELVQKSNENPEIILGGDGNDQHFGTSGKELALHWKLNKQGVNGLQKLFDKIGNSPFFEHDNILFRAEFHNRKILHVQQCDIFGFNTWQLNNITKTNIKFEGPTYLKEFPTKFTSFDDFYFSRNLNVDIKQVINNVILFKSSRMAKLFGNSMSFPYMSTDLYNFLATIPVDYKFHGTLEELSKGKGTSKYLHKKYLKPKLPPEITNRKKQGGFAPLPIFLRDDKQRTMIFNYLRRSDVVKNLFDYKSIDKLLLHYDSITQTSGYWFWYQQVKANQIINLLTLAVWWEMFINKKTELKMLTELL